MLKQRYTEIAPDLVLIIAHGGSPTAEEWAHDLQHARGLKVKKLRRLIVSTDGSALTTAQRKELEKVFVDKGIESLTAVMTSSSAVRAVFTVVRWLGVHTLRVFSLDQISLATGFLSMTDEEIEAARKVLNKHMEPSSWHQQAS